MSHKRLGAISSAKRYFNTKNTNTKRALPQWAIFLLTLKKHTATSLEARHHLGILSPAARVHDLRKKGWNVVTYWVRQESRLGRHHWVALYVLLAGRYSR